MTKSSSLISIRILLIIYIPFAANNHISHRLFFSAASASSALWARISLLRNSVRRLSFTWQYLVECVVGQSALITRLGLRINLDIDIMAPRGTV